jgi:hypothetical protein
MVRIGIPPSLGGPSAINDPDVKFHGNCIAERCAMWRWAPGVGMHQEINTGEVRYVMAGFGFKRINIGDTFDVPNAPTHGYCGLSGRPV